MRTLCEKFHSSNLATLPDKIVGTVNDEGLQTPGSFYSILNGSAWLFKCQLHFRASMEKYIELKFLVPRVSIGHYIRKTELISEGVEMITLQGDTN